MGNAAVKDGACPQSAQQCLKFGWPFVRPMSILVDHLLGQFYSHVILSCSSHCYTLSSCCLPFIFILRSRPTSVHFSSSFFIFFPTDLQLSLALFCPHSLSLFIYVFFFLRSVHVYFLGQGWNLQVYTGEVWRVQTIPLSFFSFFFLLHKSFWSAQCHIEALSQVLVVRIQIQDVKVYGL